MMDLNYEIFDKSQVDVFLSKFANADEIAYDIEASSLAPFEISFKCGGVGLATRDYSAYLKICDFWDMDYDSNDPVFKKVGKFLAEKDNTSTIYVFNLKYEVPATIALFGVELKNVVDVMQEGITLGVRGGLKNISQKELKLSNWTDSVDLWNDSFGAILKHIRPTSNLERPEESKLRDAGILAVYEYCINKNKLNKREVEIKESIATLVEILQDSYEHTTDIALSKLTELFINRLDASDFDKRYTEIPGDIVGKYCCWDAMNTIKLHDVLYSRLQKLGIEDASKYYNEHNYLGYELEKNGARWDDTLADALAKEYHKVSINALRNFILHDNVSNKLSLNNSDKFLLQSTESIDDLKDYFNPQSNKKETRELMNKILITQEVKVILMLDNVGMQLTNNEGLVKKKYPKIYTYYSQVKDAERSKKYSLIKKIKDNIANKQNWSAYTKDEISLLVKYANYTMESLDMQAIDSLYAAFAKIGGVNPSDETTWFDCMYLLYQFKVYKKATKVKSTYVDGSLGRGAVYVVKKSDMDDYVDNIRLIRPYDENLKENEDYLHVPSFRVNLVETKRWSAGVHTIPRGSELRDLYVPRSPNGFIVHMDYSQAEVRVLANISQDENLLQAFRDNKDVHKYTAAKVWNKKEEDVSEVERKFSKAVVFSILYGNTIENVADTYFNGNKKEAQQLFGYFFSSFPKVKDYIDEAHKQLLKNGCVNTLWGDPIYIRFDKGNNTSINRAKRQAQNYIIQSTASNMAGVCLNRIRQYIKENNFKSKMFCFTHDSVDIDVPGDEVLQLCHQLPEIAEGIPNELWNLPAKVDIEIATSGNKLVKLERKDNAYVKKNGNKYKLDCEFSGEEESINQLIDRLKSNGYNVNHEINETKTHDGDIGDLFAKKQIYSINIGKSLIINSGTIKTN